VWFDPKQSLTDEPAATSNVPIQNLYYLLCYATKCLSVRDRIDVESLDGPTPAALYAKVLDQGLGRLRRRGFPKRYRDREEETAYPRGRINFAPTVSRALLQQRKVSCTISELVHDHTINRAFKAAARVLAGAPGVPHDVRVRLRGHAQILGSVADWPIRQIDIVGARRERRLDALTAFMLDICRLVQQSALISPAGDDTAFFDLRGSASAMGAVFEEFLFEFYRQEQRTFTVSRPHLNWQHSAPMGVDTTVLPTMRTDVMLESANARVLIEAKCTAKTMESHKGGKPKLRSSHLYQILNYLDHVATDRPKTGLLLYAQSGNPLDLRFEIAGHRLMVRSVDLEQDWQGIHRDVLATLGDAQGWAA
jgi:5-methylcytosine-specific restriction enzyme subunit McrC